MKPVHMIVGVLCVLLLGAAAAPQARAAEFVLPAAGSIVGEVRAITIESDVTLYDIARHYDLGFEELASSNPGVNAWVPGRGQRIVLPIEFILPPKPWTGIVVNLAARRLYYFPKAAAGQPATVVTFPIGIGRPEWETPLGKTRITAKVRNPAWRVPKSILAEHAQDGNPLPAVVPPGPDNPMGLLALRTGFPGIYIHGTNEPWGVGGLVSHGCIHLYPEDVAAIFYRESVNTPVRLIHPPVLVGERDSLLYLASFRPSGKSSDAAPAAKPVEQQAVDAVVAYLKDRTMAIDWERVRETARLGLRVPTPINVDTVDFQGLAANIPAEPYDHPPYGPEANAAVPPPPRIE
jgi:L,D-transpeptidase ErfK/SrfK